MNPQNDMRRQLKRVVSALTHRVWLGSRASIWSHRGYVVRGESVYCESRADADHVVGAELGYDLIEVQDHYYRSQDDADRDVDGSRAIAVIDETSDLDEDA